MSNAPRTADLLVVGLGPGGARSAHAAARAGLSVIAVDRRSRPGFPVQCAEFVPALMAQEIDGLEAVTQQEIEAMVTVVENQPPDLRNNFRGRMVDRCAFDRLLVGAASNAGADCRFGVQLGDLSEDGVARLSDGTAIAARIIIGADGPRSRIGMAIGQVNREIVETRQVTLPLLKPQQSTDIYLSAAFTGGYAWLFPRGERANLGLGMVPQERHRLKPLLDDLHRRLIAEGRVGRGVIGHTGGAIPVGGMLDPAGRVGDVPVLLVGDAAGLTNPVSGAGINAAVLSGSLAGNAAAAWLGGDADAPRDYAEELAGLFGTSIDRAVRRRRAVMAIHERAEQPSPDALRTGWIAYPEYWADDVASPQDERELESAG